LRNGGATTISIPSLPTFAARIIPLSRYPDPIQSNSREILRRDTDGDETSVESKYFLVPAALGTAEAVGGAEAREGETRGSQEERQARSQRKRIYRGQATSSGKV